MRPPRLHVVGSELASELAEVGYESLTPDNAARLRQLASDGAFDVTLGPVVRLWREARRTQRLPDATALQAAAARTGLGKLHLDARARTALLDIPGMALDLGAIGKAMGGRGKLVKSVEDLKQVTQEFIANPAPTLVDVRLDRSVITLPYRRIHYGRDD